MTTRSVSRRAAETRCGRNASASSPRTRSVSDCAAEALRIVEPLAVKHPRSSAVQFAHGLALAGIGEKEKALELAVSSIEKQFGKGSIMRLGVIASVGT